MEFLLELQSLWHVTVGEMIFDSHTLPSRIAIASFVRLGRGQEFVSLTSILGIHYRIGVTKWLK